MKLEELSGTLDREFSIPDNGENLVEWAVNAENRAFLNEGFLRNDTGLMLASSERIENVVSTVFVGEAAVDQAIRSGPSTLLFTHHHFGYHDDERGLSPLSPETLQALSAARVSLFVAHAGLDTHAIWGTSFSLARLFGIEPEKMFYDYFGAPTALIGRIPKNAFESFCEEAKGKLERPFLTMEKKRDQVEKIAIVAGGGDIPALLRQAFILGCDTLLGGTIENRWSLPAIQKENKDFLELNEILKLNLIGGTHYGTERPAMRRVVRYFEDLGLNAAFCEDRGLLSAR